MGMIVTVPTPVVVTSLTVLADVPISLVTDEGEQVTDNGDPVFLFDANGTDSIQAPVVVSPITVTSGGTEVTTWPTSS